VKEELNQKYVYIIYHNNTIFLFVRNFAKFLCDANGIPVKRYGPKKNPLSFESDIISLLQLKSGDVSTLLLLTLLLKLFLVLVLVYCELCIADLTCMWLLVIVC
jgi:hypothetical protein